MEKQIENIEYEKGVFMIQLYLCTCLCEETASFGFSEIMTLVSTASAVITLVMTVIISLITNGLQKKLAVSQSWENLVTEYRKSDFGIAVKAVVDFYVDDCDRCLSQIQDKYISRYKEDFPDKKQGASCPTICKNKRIEDTLHFYRRLLEQYYWQLWICINSNGFRKKLVKQYFNSNEMNIIVIVYYMGQAASDSIIYKPLLPYRRERAVKCASDISMALRNLYAFFYAAFTPKDSEVLHFM